MSLPTRKTDNINKTVEKGIETRRMVKALVNQGFKNVEIAKRLGLDKSYVSQIKTDLTRRDLTLPTNVLLAHKALKSNLKSNDMTAVKLVYDTLNKEGLDKDRLSVTQGNTTININFDGLSNKAGVQVITNKVDTYGKDGMAGVIIDATPDQCEE